MVYLGEIEGVAAVGDPLVDKVDWDGLESKGHVGSGGGVSRESLLSPERVDVIVELCVNFGACASVIVALKMSAATIIEQVR